MSKRIRRRDIELIATELQGALKRQATDIIAKPMVAFASLRLHCRASRSDRMARSLRRSEIVVKHGRDHDHRAGRDRYRADHRPRFKDGDDDRPPVIVCLVREAPACHTHSEPSGWPPASGLPLTTRSARILAACNYLAVMLKNAFKPCIPTRAAKVPDRPEWIHKIKHDGYRFVQRDGKRAPVHAQRPRLEQSLPADIEAALRNRNSSFVIDGEALLLGVDGRSDFNGLHSRKHDAEVQFYAFDMLVSDGEDLRKPPLSTAGPMFYPARTSG